MTETQAGREEEGPSGKRYLMVEIALVLGVLCLPGEWLSVREYLLEPFDIRLQSDGILRILYDAGYVGLIMFILWGAGESFERFGIGKLRPRDIGIFAVSLACSFLVAVAVDVAWTSAHLPSFGAGPGRAPGIPWPASGVALAAFFPSALFQELLMRGYLITRLEDLWQRKWLALTLSCILFGAWHFYQGGRGTASATLVGMVFGLVFLRWRRVWPLAAAHGVFNVLIQSHVVLAVTGWVGAWVARFA